MRAFKKIAVLGLILVSALLTGCATVIPPEQLAKPVLERSDEDVSQAERAAITEFAKDYSKRMSRLVAYRKVIYPTEAAYRREGGVVELEATFYGWDPKFTVTYVEAKDESLKRDLIEGATILADQGRQGVYIDKVLRDKNFRLTIAFTYTYDNEGPMVVTAVH